jgi:predicted tellurium resistance membrane protein TerC
MNTQQTVTSLPPSPADDRRVRMIKYTVAMSIRVVCVLLMFVVHGWWLLLVVIGAVVLPYIAVVLANNTHGGVGGSVERPGGIVVVPRPENSAPLKPRILEPGE